MLTRVTLQWLLFKHIDKEEYVLSTNIDITDIHPTTGTTNFGVKESELNKSENRPAPIADNETYGISQKM